jgi:flagellar FliL protein
MALAVTGAAAGFIATRSELVSVVLGNTETGDRAARTAFLPVDPIIVSLGPASDRRHLSFRAELEVSQGHEAEVARMMPRFVDVLNGYLRAVDVREFDDPLGLIRIRGQMLHRIQMLTGDDTVSDLLIMEFVLN